MQALMTFFQTFIQGGIAPMAIITFILIALVISIFKAHKWVKYAGIGALVMSLILALATWVRAASAVIECNGEIAPSIVWAGVRSAAIIIIYGLIVYLVSVIARGFIKTRKK